MPEARKTVTVLFADVVASTELGERLDPETLRQVVTRYFAEMAAVLERHGGTVEKFIGDEVMAVFGVPAIHEDDALRAVRAAAQMRERLAELNEELESSWGARLEIRTGINTGEVVAGDPSAGHGFVTGDSVTLAKRIEQAAKPGEILLGEATARLVRHAVAATPVGPLSVKGRSGEFPAFRLEGVDPASEALPRRFDVALVDRTAELAALRASFQRAVETRQPQLVTLLGPAGIGKSRLARELLAGVGGGNVLVGRCLPYGEGITYWPVVEILPGESLEGTSEEIFWRIRKRLEALARARALVVCLEDLHWGEPKLLDLVEYLAGWIDDAPIVLLCLTRPELLEKRPDWPQGEPDRCLISLGPLSEADADAFLEHLNAPLEARSRIVEAAEGNPLFVEQMSAMQAEDGAEMVVPPSIQAVLAARLDRLDPDEAAVLERASVIGRDFPLRAVMELVPGELRPRASTLLLGLVRNGLVRPLAVADEDGFRFRHALIRDVAYDGMPKALRAELHEQHAAWLEAAAGPDFIVGYHLEQAVRLRRELGLPEERTRELALAAGELMTTAGRRAFRRDDVPAAVNLLERAARLLDGQGERLAELLTELGTALGTAGRLADADTVLDQALGAARASSDRRSELRALLLREQLRSFTAKTGPEAYARVAAAAIPELETLGDDLGLAKAWRLASSADVMTCRWAARTDALERALVHARRVPDAPQERSSLVAVLVQALYYGPVTVQEGIARYRSLLVEAEDDPAVRAVVLAHLGGLLAMQGDFDAAHRFYDESVALHDELGLRFRRAVVSLVGAEIATLEGDAAGAERQLRAGSDALEAIGASGARAALVSVLADLLCTEGRDDEASALADLTEQVAEEGDVLPHTLRLAVVGRVQARGGSVQEGLHAVRAAVGTASATDFPWLQAATLVALAEVEGLAGDTPAARQAYDAALAAYEGKGNLVAAERVARSLALAT